MGADAGLDQEQKIAGKALTDLLSAAMSRWVGP